MSILQLNNIHKTFNMGTPNQNHVLKGVDIDIKEGDFITVIGGNGAGKSTFLNTVAGTFSVEEGSVIIGGKDITDIPAYKRSKYVSRVFQDTIMGTASRLTIAENLSIAYKRGKKRGLARSINNKQIELFKEELSKLQLGLENRLDMEVGLLSGGQRQALTLLMATIVDPKILLLDEHTAALDPKTSEMVLTLTEQIVHEKNLTTIMVTHNMEHAIKYGNRLIMMADGKIAVDVQGDRKQGLTVPKLLELFQQSSGQEITDDSLILG